MAWETDLISPCKMRCECDGWQGTAAALHDAYPGMLVREHDRASLHLRYRLQSASMSRSDRSMHPDCHVPLSRKTSEELEQGSVNFHRALLLRPVPAPGEHLHLPQARHEMVQVGDELVHAWG